VTRVRLMSEEDIPAVHEAMIASFDDLDRRMGEKYAGASPRLDQSRIRFGRLLATDPEGSLVAEHGGKVAGAAVALLREGLWGLSMFIVAPDAQGHGLGRELLARAVAYGEGARGRVILSSRDPRAMAAYARLGLELHPTVSATGAPRAAGGGDELRPGGPADLPLTEAVDRSVRGAAHGEDILALVKAGAELLVLPERGYALRLGGTVRMLAAFDEDAARTLLRGTLARIAAARESANVEWISARQPWAVGVCLDAGLALSTNAGPLFLGGDVGPFRPYLPSGSYL
jgi:ribosomal protein S18 acetylase RimI-like enzyme